MRSNLPQAWNHLTAGMIVHNLCVCFKLECTFPLLLLENYKFSCPKTSDLKHPPKTHSYCCVTNRNCVAGFMNLCFLLFFVQLWRLCLMGLKFNCIQHVRPHHCRFEWQVAIHPVIKKSIQLCATLDGAAVSLSIKWRAGQLGFDFR